MLIGVDQKSLVLHVGHAIQGGCKTSGVTDDGRAELGVSPFVCNDLKVPPGQGAVPLRPLSDPDPEGETGPGNGKLLLPAVGDLHGTAGLPGEEGGDGFILAYL